MKTVDVGPAGWGRRARHGEVLVGGSNAFAPVRKGSSGTEQGFVYVTRRLSPHDYPVIRRAAAVICEQGGKADHGAVICRILDRPVLRVAGATSWLRDGMTVGVDTAGGRVGVEWRPPRRTDEIGEVAVGIVSERQLALQVSVVGPREIELANRVSPLGGGVAAVSQFFVREELLWAAHGLDPYGFLAEHGVEATARRLAGWLRQCLGSLRPGQSLNYRALDWRPDPSGESGEDSEPNPDLGLHGVRRLLAEPDFLAAELRALDLLGERHGANLIFSLPFVTDRAEVDAVRSMVPRRSVRLGLFVETPAAAIEVERLIGTDVAAVYVGTKDLTQTILACDRSNTRVQYLYDCAKPAVLAAIEWVLAAAAEREVPAMVFTLLDDLPRLAARSSRLGGISICCGEYLQIARAHERSSSRDLTSRSNGSSAERRRR